MTEEQRAMLALGIIPEGTVYETNGLKFTYVNGVWQSAYSHNRHAFGQDLLTECFFLDLPWLIAKGKLRWVTK